MTKQEEVWEVIDALLDRQQAFIESLTETIKEQNSVIHDLLVERRSLELDNLMLNFTLAKVNPLLYQRHQ